MDLKSRTMQIFEVKPRNKRISFGDLADLKHVIDNAQGFKQCDDQMLYRKFLTGNYLLSTIMEKSNPIVVLHQENVSPHLLLKKLEESRGKSPDMSTTSVETGEGWPKYPDFPSVLKPFDWLQMKKGEIPVGKVVEDAIYKEVYKVHEKDGDGDKMATEKARNSSRLFYFVSDLLWKSESIANVKISSVESNVYKLAFDGKPIGIAFNPADMMGDGPKRGAIFVDPDNRNCFALIMQNEPDEPSIDDNVKLSYPVSAFLYENEYRCFFKDGKASENPFYGGGNNSGQFDFSRLPSNVFVKILLELPWKERVLNRRVSKPWLKAANSALVVSTKVIDTEAPQYKKMQPDDINYLIPIVADGVESFTIRPVEGGNIQSSIKWYSNSSIQSFRYLRELSFERLPADLNSDQFFTLLAKCPNLTALLTVVPVQLSNETLPRRAYKSLEKLTIPCRSDAINVNDPYLMAITDYFPNLVQISIWRCGYVTGSGASAFVEQYGGKLVKLELKFLDPSPIPKEIDMDIVNTGAFTGIGVCENLTSLALVNSNLISNSFMSALSNGCKKLETLALKNSAVVTNEGLGYLAELTSLKMLNISNCGLGLNQGVNAIITKGVLEQLLAKDIGLEAETAKNCIRNCQGLLLLDIRGDDYLSEDVEQLVTLWGRYGRAARLVIRTDNWNWRSEEIGYIQLAIKAGSHNHRGQLVVDSRLEMVGFLQDNDDEIDPNTLLLEDEIEEGESDVSGGGYDHYYMYEFEGDDDDLDWHGGDYFDGEDYVDEEDEFQPYM